MSLPCRSIDPSHPSAGCLPCMNMDSSQPPELSGRDAPPTHFSIKICSFSSLSQSSIEKYSSDKFQAGDYKWKLLIYPDGNKKRDGADYISIYLALVDTDSLPVGWEVNAIFNLFVYNQLNDKYYGVQGGRVRRFHAMKTDWGLTKFMDVRTFSAPSNGYLIDDSCVFGAEVFVLKQTNKAECLSVMPKPVAFNYTWKIRSFPSLTLERYESEPFVVHNHKWRIRAYPRGNGEGKGNSISVFLCLDESTLPPDTRVLVRYTLRAVNQSNQEHSEIKDETQFGPSVLNWGSRKFMALSKLYDPKMGFLVDDTCIIEVQMTILGTVCTLSS